MERRCGLERTRAIVKLPRGSSDPLGMHPARSWPLVVALAWGLTASASAEIYRWTDAQGRVHFTQDLSQVPAAQREPAARVQPRSRGGYRRVPGAGGSDGVRSQGLRAPPAAVSRVASRGRGPIHIPYESKHGAMLVMVRLNDAVTAPFIVDTGATDVSIPAAVAERAGIHVGPETPRALYKTANGTVSHAQVNVDSIQVGEARVEAVRGSISHSMPIGLLGGSFFNNFTFQIDPAAGVITLLRNDRVRSGISEREWRARFARIHGKIETLERYIEDNHFTRESRREELEGRMLALRQRLQDLEAEADRAEVPQAWRQG